MSEIEFPHDPQSFDDYHQPPDDRPLAELFPKEPLSKESIHDFLQRDSSKLLRAYSNQRDWGWGVATTKLEVYESLTPLECVVIDLDWSGNDEQPDHLKMRWSLWWSHLMDYFGGELGNYLTRFCPAPREVLQTLKDSLPPELQKYFKDLPEEEEEAPGA